jgi:hypothetical protein
MLMNTPTRRRAFLRSLASTAGIAWSAAELGLVFPRVSAAETKLDSDWVSFAPDIEPLVHLIENTSRDRLLEEIGSKIRRGLSYREVLTALFLAGTRNVQPRPIGFKFHAVLVVHAAHLASIESPDEDRWLPIFWALDYFKQSQAENKRSGDWHLREVDAKRIPSATTARAAVVDALEKWDESALDSAVAGLIRSGGAQEAIEIFYKYGARDFHEIGHKAIYTANCWRLLQTIGWRHAEPIFRSLAYGLLDYSGESPAKRDDPLSRPWKDNLVRLRDFKGDWLEGKPSMAATQEMLVALREGSTSQSCGRVVELVNRGAAPASIWDACFQFGGELLVRAPGIIPIHAITSANALRFAFTQTASDETRRLLLLQAVAILVYFRGDARPMEKLEDWEPLPPAEGENRSPREILADLGGDRHVAARKLLGQLRENPDPADFMKEARRLIFLKGRDAHDYKFSSAVIEDFRHISPAIRDRYLAASLFNLHGNNEPDNPLTKRIRAALA